MCVQVFFSNPDLLWQAEWPAPRFGQGGQQALVGEGGGAAQCVDPCQGQAVFLGRLMCALSWTQSMLQTTSPPLSGLPLLLCRHAFCMQVPLRLAWMRCTSG